MAGAAKILFLLGSVRSGDLPRCGGSFLLVVIGSPQDLTIKNLEIAINRSNFSQNIDLIGSETFKPDLLMPLCERD